MIQIALLGKDYVGYVVYVGRGQCPQNLAVMTPGINTLKHELVT